jgi:hypothetical protein
MSLRFVSPGAISCACDAVQKPATIVGLALWALGIAAALAGRVGEAALVLTLSAFCAGVSIGALLVERRFR